MESDYVDYIIDNTKFSYSSITTYENCPYAWKLAYIDCVDREPNFFSDYGLLIHESFENFFLGKLDYYDLAKFFEDSYDDFVVTSPPSFSKNMRERYLEDGVKFFSEFEFDINNYEVIDVEGRLDFQLDDDIYFTGRPDLVLRDKTTGKTILFDYKSSSVFKKDYRTGNETVNKERISEYHRQMYLYAKGLREDKGIQIDEITLWFTRPDRKVTISWDKKEEDRVAKWATKLIKKIKTAKSFPYNNSNKFFCTQLCGVRNSCEYKPEE